MKPNAKFEMSVRDINMIEHALRDRQRQVSVYRVTLNESEFKSKEDLENIKLADRELIEISDLLGRIHDQKVWYRPKKKVYVSG